MRLEEVDEQIIEIPCGCKVSVECNKCCRPLDENWGYCVSPIRHMADGVWNIWGRYDRCPIHLIEGKNQYEMWNGRKYSYTSPILYTISEVRNWRGEKNFWVRTYSLDDLNRFLKHFKQKPVKTKQAAAKFIMAKNVELKEKASNG